ncbi:hypothetical protein ACMD2_03782 [Ananas comosus]|uniref:Uncharacterized protein n=1 Tax=Ananas comosus TaxID=4615 RepID=A0A199V053_ANACO|nr:hypothetical protein ACMD2_03782 [Ananas comosus]
MIPPNLLSFPSSSTPPPPVRNPNPNLGFGVPSPAPVARPRRFRCPCRRAGAPSWGSNAESVRAGRFGRRGPSDGRDEVGDSWGKEKRRWWSDESSEELDEDFDFDFDPDEGFWDKIWIFKVFKAYGYLLPAIIASMLLATGPKAFLMALALPLGQSAVSLAIEKIWGKNREGPRTKPKTKKKPFARPTDDFFKRQRQDVSSGENNGKPSYHSWVSADNGSEGSKSSKPSFGGWDELDRQGNLNNGPVRTQSRTINGSGLSEEPVNKLSTKGRYRDAPLLLRLLIAVFPFLGSWTRIL